MGHQNQDEAAVLFSANYADNKTAMVPVAQLPPSDEGKEEEAMTDLTESEDEDGYDPMEILPEEVWDMIFGHIRDSPKSLINCCKASASWDALLTSSKPTWMFKETFPFVFGYLKNHDILKCRLICRSWRNSVDTFIENHPCHHPSAPEEFEDGDTKRDSVYYPLVKKKLLQIRFQEAEDLTRFRLQMERYSRNPIIGRSVCFFCRPQEEWMSVALHFLSEFGKHIWYFSFESLHAPVQAMQWLRQCLAYLPNLKKLRIYSCHFGPGNNNPEIVEELTEEIRVNPLPPLPALETLEIFTKDLPLIFQDTVFSNYAGQVHRLETDDWHEMYVHPNDFSFTTLKELTLKVDSNEVLETLSRLECPLLRKLNFFLRYRDIDLRILSRVLSHFRENLRVLKITLTASAGFAMQKFLEPFANVVLPKLKVLVLVNADNLPYNFLQGMTTIKYLHFEKWKSGNDSDPDSKALEIIQVKGYIPYARTGAKVWVWDVLPALQRLTYQEIGKPKEVSSRQMYEYNSRKGE